MAILQGIKLKDDETIHQLDWEKGIGNKPTIPNAQIQSDYLQDDETALDFIKNRPFHDNMDAREIIVEETQYTLEKSHYDDYYFISDNKPIIQGMRFFENEKLIYVYNGVEYECTTKYKMDEDGIIYFTIGNLKINTADGEDTGEPFYIVYMLAGDTTLYGFECLNETVTLEVIRPYKTVKHLDPKYIKDMYYEVNTDVEIVPLQNIELINMEGYGVQLPLNTYCEVKIGDYIKVMYDGVEYNCEIFDFGALVGQNVKVPAFGNIGLMLGEGDTGEPFVMSMDTTGALAGVPCIVIQDFTEVQEGVESITREIGITYNVSKINYIDPKYIKDMYGNFGTENVLLLPQGELPCRDMGNGLYGLGVNEKLFNLEEGKTYIVNWDGVDYECVATAGEFNSTKAIGLGNGSIIGMGEDTGEPFILGMPTEFDGGLVYTTSTEPTHIASLSVKNEIIKQIPSKYLPTDYIKGLIDDAITTALNTEV